MSVHLFKFENGSNAFLILDIGCLLSVGVHASDSESEAHDDTSAQDVMDEKFVEILLTGPDIITLFVCDVGVQTDPEYDSDEHKVKSVAEHPFRFDNESDTNSKSAAEADNPIDTRNQSHDESDTEGSWIRGLTIERSLLSHGIRLRDGEIRDPDSPSSDELPYYRLRLPAIPPVSAGLDIDYANAMEEMAAVESESNSCEFNVTMPLPLCLTQNSASGY